MSENIFHDIVRENGHKADCTDCGFGHGYPIGPDEDGQEQYQCSNCAAIWYKSNGLYDTISITKHDKIENERVTDIDLDLDDIFSARHKTAQSKIGIFPGFEVKYDYNDYQGNLEFQFFFRDKLTKIHIETVWIARQTEEEDGYRISAISRNELEEIIEKMISKLYWVRDGNEILGSKVHLISQISSLDENQLEFLQGFIADTLIARKTDHDLPDDHEIKALDYDEAIQKIESTLNERYGEDGWTWDKPDGVVPNEALTDDDEYTIVATIKGDQLAGYHVRFY